jgi:hypothetical protein
VERARVANSAKAVEFAQYGNRCERFEQAPAAVGAQVKCQLGGELEIRLLRSIIHRSPARSPDRAYRAE